MQSKNAGSSHCSVLTGTINSSLSQTVSLLLAAAELVGLGSFLSPGLGALCREVNSTGTAMAGHHGRERARTRGLPRAEGSAQLSSAALCPLLFLLCSHPVGPWLQPLLSWGFLAGMTPLSCITSSLGSCSRVWEMLKRGEIFWLCTYILWFECAQKAVCPCR